METWSGYVERIVFRSEESGFSVIEISTDGEERMLTGRLSDVEAGEFIEAEGQVVVHRVYGEQMNVSSYTHRIPDDPLLVAKYLGSGMIKGIGEALAMRIVKRFGEDTIRVIEEEPEKLAEVKGISMRSALMIGSQVAEKKDQRDAMMFLQQYGISPKLATKIYNTYGDSIYTTIKENPYRLADDITGVGFKTADEIAGKVGIRADSEFRIRSGIIYTLTVAEGNGHTCLPMEALVEETARMLQVLPDMVEEQLEDLVYDRRVVVRVKDTEETAEVQRYVYRVELHRHETETARKLLELDRHYEVDEDAYAAKIAASERARGVQLDDQQREAVLSVVKNGVSILTGGPGTGKTTTIMILLDLFEAQGLEILLAAPTGRAAKRMAEATGRDASTVHRMLELSGVPGEENRERMYFARNEERPLEADVIIVDEASMIDIFLIYALMKAVPYGARLVFVGDVDQLPSVGPGNVLRDLIDSGCFAVSRLSRIFRQSEGSDIVVNAHRINRGEPVDLHAQSRDFLFIGRAEADRIISACITLVKEKLPRYVNADPYDIQVMTPMRGGNLGVERLNKIFQQYLNPPAEGKAEAAFGARTLRVGDKVMQIKNDYQAEWEVRNRYGIAVDCGTGVFNGDMGIVRDINHFTEELEVEFDEGRVVVYPFKNVENLEHAFAITIHKSQGSEYPAVVLPLLSGPAMLMTRNLLYTAVTRAKSCVCIVGSERMFASMIENVSEIRRFTGLKDFLRLYAEN